VRNRYPWWLVFVIGLGGVVPLLLFRDPIAVYAYLAIAAILWFVVPWAMRRNR
jgi:hypothetical protein